jgi:hypothetical protein
MKTFSQWLRWVVMCLSMMAFFNSCSGKPVTEFEEARQALKRAVEQNAPKFSPDTFVRALATFRAADEEWHAQNGRWSWERDYSTTVDLLVLATLDAHRATEEAILNQRDQ